MAVHGDDFTVLGHKANLDWFRQKITERYEVKFRGRLGPETEDDKAIRILNRLVQWTSGGIEYEADQRHAELIVADAGLNMASGQRATPGVKANLDEASEPLNAEETTRYRSSVARAIYLSQDRPDILYAVKELSRNQCNPTERDTQAVKRLARYLIGCPRLVQRFEYQEYNNQVQAWVDTDFAGCEKTRRSTSGGTVALGKHAIKSWSTTQSVIALSSGEAEYYGLVKGGSVGIGIQSMLLDMGVETEAVVLNTDATAAKGIASRRGLGKLRHLAVSQLWLQGKVASGLMRIEKVKGTENVADALTKHVERDKLQRHIESMNMEVRQGRHELMPEVPKTCAA